MNSDLNVIMKDFNTIEKMFEKTQRLLQEVERRPPLKLQQSQDQVSSQVASHRTALESEIRDLSIRTSNLEAKLAQEHSSQKERSLERERSNRQKLVEARVTNDVPQSMISPELHEIIETSRKEVRTQAEASGSWLKTLLTWAVLAGVIYFMYRVYTGLKEEAVKIS